MPFFSQVCVYLKLQQCDQRLTIKILCCQHYILFVSSSKTSILQQKCHLTTQ